MSRVGDWYTGIAEEAGLDPTDEGVIEKVTLVLGTIALIDPKMSIPDVTDAAIDALLSAGARVTSKRSEDRITATLTIIGEVAG